MDSAPVVFVNGDPVKGPVNVEEGVVTPGAVAVTVGLDDSEDLGTAPG